MIEDSGIAFTFLRPNFFMQNFVTFFSRSIKEQGAFYLPAGDGKISFVDVRDIAPVAVQALTKNNDGKHDGKAYSITGQRQFLMGMLPEFYLSKSTRKYLM